MNIPLQTIADLAGVSRATVSLALRNSPSLSAATRDRVRKIADDIGYRPNPLISTLMTHLRSARPLVEQGTLAFLTNHDTRNGWRGYRTYQRFFDGAAQRADQTGYRLEDFWMKEAGMTGSRMKKILESRGIRGAVIAPLPGRGGHISMDVSGLATATFGLSMKRPLLHRADNNQIESMRTAMRELKRRGYRRIGLALRKSDDSHSNFNWSMSYQEYQNRAMTSRLPIYYPDTSTKATLLAWLKKTKADVMLCISPFEYTMIEGAVAVPEQLGVVVMDRTDNDHGIAGIDGRPDVTGAAAVDLVIGQISRNERGVPASPKLVLTEGVWVEGATVRPPRG